jgi:hypothetical protein
MKLDIMIVTFTLLLILIIKLKTIERKLTAAWALLIFALHPKRHKV